METEPNDINQPIDPAQGDPQPDVETDDGPGDEDDGDDGDDE